MSKIAFLGCGGWAMALSLAAHDSGNTVTMWSLFEKEAEELNKTRANNRLLSGVTLPKEILVTSDITKINGADITVIAVPSFAVRETAKRLKNIDCGIVVNVSKGLEADSSLRLSEVIKEELPQKEIVVFSGPTHAEEVARRVPSTIVASSENLSAAEKVQAAFNNDYLRVYTNDDIIGAELGGAFKNVIAVAAGIIDGLGCGDNTKAALITRGLAEITRLGVTLGAKPTTFLGLTGIGDLVVTCTSHHSRNHQFGLLVGKGMNPQKALAQVGTVEGYYAAAAAVKIAQEKNIEMPICEQCYEIMYNGADCEKALNILMNRPSKPEGEF